MMNFVNVNYLVIVAATVMFAVFMSWRLTATDVPRATTWMWSTTTSLSSRTLTWILHCGHREQAAGAFVSENLKKYTYLDKFGGKYEMVVYDSTTLTMTGCSSYLQFAQEDAKKKISTRTWCTTSWRMENG